MTRVLVPYDGSDTALKAVNYAAGLAQKNPETEITLMLVVNIGNLDYFEASLDTKEKFIQSSMEYQEPILDKARSILEQKNIPVNAVLVAGDPAAKINEYANNNNIDSIIMGTRGLGSLTGMVLGSVSHKVIHLTDKPVTLIK
ncbi:universal stress protein UspA [Desulfocucumis palustris]|uniref:Universal stress protein UspA n=1 Tax=Desulfocucumis palustris TaxID=1898651 RepID=A0A2L2XI16_9FIRM|nr:universal stress protein [Desulfocucumis palustris]GBF33886.1 universal stress protein UspA [Desulfocucumis palustris]